MIVYANTWKLLMNKISTAKQPTGSVYGYTPRKNRPVKQNKQ